jgi:hypothetical protein
MSKELEELGLQFDGLLKDNDTVSIGKLIAAQALTDEQTKLCIDMVIARQEKTLLVELLKLHQPDFIANVIAEKLGKAIYGSQTDKALYIINELTPLLEDGDWTNTHQFPPLIYAVIFQNDKVISAMVPKLSLAQLGKTTDSNNTALSLAIRDNKTVAVKAITKRKLELFIEKSSPPLSTSGTACWVTVNNIDVSINIANKLIGQIDGKNIILNQNERKLAQKGELGAIYAPYQNSCAKGADFNALRQLFFNSFNYLDANDRRIGFFTKIFGNHELSKAIVVKARILKIQLLSIDCNDDTAFEQLLDNVKKSITDVRQLRDEHAPTHHDEEHGRPNRRGDRWSVEYDYKKPYANGQFEKNIVKALLAIRPHLYDSNQQQKIDTMCKTINDYKPKEIQFNVSTYAP